MILYMVDRNLSNPDIALNDIKGREKKEKKVLSPFTYRYQDLNPGLQIQFTLYLTSTRRNLPRLSMGNLRGNECRIVTD